MKIIFRKQIHGCFAGASSLDVWLHKNIDIPFAPFVGLVIQIDEYNDFTINELVYILKKRVFIAYEESDKEIYEAELRKEPHRPLKEIVQGYLNNGWCIDKENKKRILR
jgi:hypothetical protein